MDDRPYITYEGIYILGADGIQITPECIDEDVEAPLAILPDDRKILVCEWEKINCGDGKATTGGTTEIQLWSGFLVAESQPGLFKAMQDFWPVYKRLREERLAARKGMKRWDLYIRSQTYELAMNPEIAERVIEEGWEPVLRSIRT